MDKLLDGGSQIGTGANTIYENLVKLSSGANTLSSGAGQLYTGVATLHDSVPALTSGVGQLKDGAKQLNDGMKKFDDEGISKVSKLLDEALPDLTDRFKAVKEAASDYGTFSGKSDSMNGSVKFIYIMDGSSD